jgi:hypothetical protein
LPTRKEADQTKRKDAGKLLLDLVPPEFMEGLAIPFMYGAEKYAPNLWKKNPMEQYRCLNSAQRHINSFRKGEQFDPEALELGWEIDHRLSAAWNLLVDWYYDTHPEMVRPEGDGRL